MKKMMFVRQSVSGNSTKENHYEIASVMEAHL
jgi:hypothetical protein